MVINSIKKSDFEQEESELDWRKLGHDSDNGIDLIIFPQLIEFEPKTIGL